MTRRMKLSKLEKSWILYDVGNSAFVLMVSTIIPIYFKSMTDAAGMAASDSTALWSYAASICTVIVAILGPIFGALADTKGFKKPLFILFMMLGVLAAPQSPHRLDGSRFSSFSFWLRLAFRAA